MEYRLVEALNLFRLASLSLIFVGNRSGMAKSYSQKAAGKAGLTKREREIVVAVAEGLTNKEIAERLCISDATVRTHLTSIFLKLGIPNRLRLLVYAYKHGMADPAE
jgi:DNA-binding NarL/FixJ family response regulator